MTAADPGIGPRPNILAINDTPENLLTLGAALASEFDLRIATSGAMGLALAEATPPDLILLDVMMPEMDGYETCRRLKADPRLRDIPAVFVTALTESGAESAGLALGAVDYITKPINADVARQRLRNLLEREHLRRKVEAQRDELQQTVAERTAQLTDRVQQLDAIFALSPDGFVSFGRDRRVSDVSPSFSGMTGLAEDAVIGHDEAAFSERLADLCVASARFRGIHALASRLPPPGRAEADRELIELARPPGRVLEVRLRQGDAGTVSQVLYLHDVSHEIEVARLKGEFMVVAAHELRTPMTSVMGFTELLLTHELDREQGRELLATAHRQAKVLASIIDELVELVELDARRGRDFAFETMNLAEAAAGAASACELPDGREPPVVLLPEAPLWVSADRARIQLAVTHLLANAYRCSPEGGEVTVSCRAVADDGARRVGIGIRDRGIGMTPEQQARCFERFYRGDISGKLPGIGLGMCIAKEIVDLHRGRIDVRSAPGAGTEVTIWLDRVGRATASDGTAPDRNGAVVADRSPDSLRGSGGARPLSRC